MTDSEKQEFEWLVAKYQCNPTGQPSAFEAIRNLLATSHRLCNENYEWAKRVEKERDEKEFAGLTQAEADKVADRLLTEICGNYEHYFCEPPPAAMEVKWRRTIMRYIKVKPEGEPPRFEAL
jgi:hypothetical protein